MVARIALVLLLFVGCTPDVASDNSYAEAHVAVTLARWTALSTDIQPGPSPDGGVCDNCGGTGRVGDGRVFVDCPVCDGDGKIEDAAGAGLPPLDAPQDPTPDTASTASSTIIVYSRDDCLPCIQWLAAEEQKLIDAGWKVDVRKAGPEMRVPRFEVYCLGVLCGTKTGYLTMSELTEMIR